MAHPIAPLPQHEADQEAGTGRVVLWIVLLNVAFWPRLWILGFWIFGSQIGRAFDGWVVPALGFLLLPWTTLIYAWMWAINSDQVAGWEWLLVGVAFLSDVFFWVAGRRSLR